MIRKLLNCFCKKEFHDTNSYRKHIDSCPVYQEYVKKYLTYDKFYELYMIDRRLYNDFLSQFPYTKFCLTDIWKLRKQCNFPQLYKTKKGRFLTHQEINEIITPEILKKYYIEEEFSADEIAKKILNNEFDHVTVIQRLKEYNLPIRSKIECKKTERHKRIAKESRNRPETIQKMRETSIKRFGVPYAIQNKQVQKKAQNTFLEKYGEISPMKCKKIQDKCKETWLKNYGVDNPFKSKVVQKKFNETCQRKYHSNWPFGNSEIQKKATASNRFLNFGYSKISIELFDELSKRFSAISNSFKYALHGDEECICSEYANFFLDFSYNQDDVKFDIEFNGDYFHANPQIYKSSDILKIEGKEKIVQDIWNYDTFRNDFIQKSGYKLLIVWERDFINNKENVINKCCEFINQCLTKNEE